MTLDTDRREAPPLRRAGRWEPSARATPRPRHLRRGSRGRGAPAWPALGSSLGILLLLVLPALAFAAGARSPSAEADPGPAPSAGAAARALCPGMPAARPWVPVDVDGDGCEDVVTIGSGRVMVHGVDGTTVYAIGERDDRVIVGDWNCDGVATPLVHRPAEGLVHEFDRWPVASETVRPTTRTVPPGVTAGVVAEGDCHRLVVADPVTGLPPPPSPVVPGAR